MIVANARWMSEQPGSSLLARHPRWVQLREVLGDCFYQVQTWMQAYGAESPKSTLLFSNMSDSASLHVPLDHTQVPKVVTCHKYTDKDGRERVQGSADLKSTQAYPPQFGDAVFHLWRRECSNTPMGPGVPIAELIASADASGYISADDWDDAELSQVISDLDRIQLSAPH